MAVVAITTPRPVAEVVAALAAARGKVSTVVATTTAVRPSQPPGEIADGLTACGLEATATTDRREAFELAKRLAGDRDEPLAVFGSNYVALDFLAWLANG